MSLKPDGIKRLFGAFKTSMLKLFITYSVMTCAKCFMFRFLCGKAICGSSRLSRFIGHRLFFFFFFVILPFYLGWPSCHKACFYPAPETSTQGQTRMASFRLPVFLLWPGWGWNRGPTFLRPTRSLSHINSFGLWKSPNSFGFKLGDKQWRVIHLDKQEK